MGSYHHLAAQLSEGALCLEDLPDLSSNTFTLTESDITVLFAQAVERSHAIPRDGWALAAVAQEAARRSGDARLEAEGALAVAETLIYWERFTSALQVLEKIRRGQDLPYIHARCDWLRGLALSRMARAGEAFQALTEAGKRLRSSSSQDEIMRWQCDLARVEMLQARYDPALELAQASLDYFNHQPGISPGYGASCEWVVAAVHFSRGRYPTALEWFAQSAARFGWAGWRADQARSQLVIAQAYVQQYRFAEALALCEQIRPTIQVLDLPASLARCDNTWGLALFKRGNPLAAVPYLERARDGFMSVGMHAFAADSELNLGRVFYDQGDLYAAIKQHQRARDLYNQHGHPLQVAHCEHNIGRCYRELGDYSKALDSFARTEMAFAELGSRIDLAICRHNRAITFSRIGDIKRARDLFSQALTLYEELALPLLAAECCTELAAIVAAQGDLALALSQIKRARQACADAPYELGIAICDQAAGDVLNGAGQYELSLDYYQNARDIFERSGRLLNVTLCDIGLANASLNLGDNAQAQVYVDRALLTDERVPDLAWWAAAIRSQLAEARGNLDEALKAAFDAVTYLGHARRSLTDESLVNTFLDASPNKIGSRSRIYDHAIQLALQTGQSESVLQIVEERRAQIMAGHLRWPRSSPSVTPTTSQARSGLSRFDELAQRRLRLQGQIANLRNMLRPRFDAESSTLAADDQSALERLRVLVNDYQETIVEASNAGWSALESPQDAPPFSLDTFQRTMEGISAGRRWTCLSYAWLGDQLIILHLNDHGKLNIVLPRLSPLDRMALRALSQPEPAWRETMYGNTSSAAAAYRRRTYDLLVPQTVRDELAPDRLLVVFPSDMLHNIPFAALQTGDSFLAQQAFLCAAPSLQTISLLEARFNPRDERNHLLAVAVDTLDGDVAALPFVKGEITALRQLWQGHVDLLEGDDATPDAIRQLSESGALLNYRVIHFAMHSVFGGEFGRLSRLILKNSSLFVDDIRSLRLRADLVVLSACQTGLGQIFHGDEILGLTYSFLAAGAQAIVASLWHVNDPKTMDLMGRFYDALNRGNSPISALAQAQRSTITDGWSPYFWAAFTLVGLP